MPPVAEVEYPFPFNPEDNDDSGGDSDGDDTEIVDPADECIDALDDQMKVRTLWVSKVAVYTLGVGRIFQVVRLFCRFS